VSDAPVFASIAPLSQTVDYSDAVQAIAITVSDVDNLASSLVVTSVAPLPSGLTLMQTAGTGSWTIAGNANVAAGSYTINLKVAESTAPGAFTTTSAAAGNQITITVIKEKTATAYTGDQNIMTASPTITTATVRLGARLTQQADGFAGDITKAKVTFELFKNGTLVGTPDLVVSGVAVDSNGDALTTVSGLAADTYNINVKIDGDNAFWVHSDIGIGVLNITVPTNDRRSNGGGWVPDSTSSSGKANFGFTVRPGTGNSGAPKGNSTFVFRGTDGYNYVVKGNSWQGGYLQFSAEPATTIFTRSNFKGSCTVQKIDPANGLIIQSWGSFSFEVFSKDGDLLNPRAADAYTITVRDRDGAIWHQVGSPSSLVNLGGGNITNKSQ
jgi:ribosomal protein L31